MNRIEVKPLVSNYGYEQNDFVIDGKDLPEYLNEIRKNPANSMDEKNSIKELDGLCPAFSKELLFDGEKRWVWALAEKDEAILPIYVCEEDLDFSCIVIVADVKKTKDCVCWRRIGFVQHKNENRKEEILHGILYHEAYTDEDWKKIRQ